MLTIDGQETTLQDGDIAKVQILGFGLSKVFFLRAGKLVIEKRQVDREHHVMPALDDAAAYVGLHLVALCAGLGIKERKDICEKGYYHFEFIALDKKGDHPENCPDCGGELQEIFDPADERHVPDPETFANRKGDVRCTGECKKFYFVVNGKLEPGHND